MKESQCLFSYTCGNEKNQKGLFIKFAEKTINDENGNIYQNTMAIVKKLDGNIVMIEPSCIQIIEDEKANG